MDQSEQKTALWWIRRDLRLTENLALSSARAQAGVVIPVFILEPNLLASPPLGAKPLAFFLEGLRRLEADLRSCGSRLIVRSGDPLVELTKLVNESNATSIYAEEDHTPHARSRDANVAASLPLHLTGGLVVQPPDAVLKSDGTPYTVFTPYARAWRALPPPVRRSEPRFGRLPTVPELPSLPIPPQPALPASVPFTPGQAEAGRRLQYFAGGNTASIYSYAKARDRLDIDGTSLLSPYLRFGMFPAQQACALALHAIDTAANATARQAAETWLIELIWREFYVSILYHYPDVLDQSFRARFRQIRWLEDESAFTAWCSGSTGYPVVDAAMRQLVETGWMHNRARMIAASFLVKDLLLDWRWGERFFMQHLIDGDPASNNGGWQWTAGTGTDAAPYFRIFNPVLQGKKHDPEGTYVRRWLPELSRVPHRFVHAPWQMPLHMQTETGCVIGRDYPAPIVDHIQARERTLAAFARARDAGT
jgi:deoxyribodipyrimidine photo-lyase